MTTSMSDIINSTQCLQLEDKSNDKQDLDIASSKVTNFKLRDYQLDALNAIQSAITKGIKRIAIVLATGGGKTVVFSHAIPQIKAQKGQGNKTLILAHRQELVHQAAATVKRFNPNLDVQIDMQRNKPNHNAEVIVASVATLTRMSRLELYNPDDFKTIILDECHHSTASGWQKILKYFNANHDKSPIYVLGFTATLERHDGEQLGKVFDEIAYSRTLSDMIANKELCDIKYHTLNIKLDLSQAKVSPTLKDFSASSLDSVMNDEKISHQIAGSFIHLKEKFNFKSTLVFCVSVEHCIGLCTVLQSLGVNAQYVTGETKKHERMNILDDFRAGKLDVLCNVMVFTEGTDIPNIDSLIIARPTKSKNLLVQMVGRGLRLHKDKDYCHVIDIADTMKVGLVSVPTLFGTGLDMPSKNASKTKKQNDKKNDIEASFDEDKLAELFEELTVRRKDAAKTISNTISIKTIEGFSSLVEKNGNSSTSQGSVADLIEKSPLCWIQTRATEWAVLLPLPKHLLFLSQSSNEGEYSLDLCKFSQPKDKKIQGKEFWQRQKNVYKIKQLTEGYNIVSILNFATKYASDQIGYRSITFVQENYALKSRPITPKQKQYILNVLGTKAESLKATMQDFASKVGEMNMAQATNLITASKISVNSLHCIRELKRLTRSE